MVYKLPILKMFLCNIVVIEMGQSHFSKEFFYNVFTLSIFPHCSIADLGPTKQIL